MSWIEVDHYTYGLGWRNPARVEEWSRGYCEKLEAGGILYFPDPPMELPSLHQEILLGQQQSRLPFHKNISYAPNTDTLRGHISHSANLTRQLRAVMRHFAKATTRFIQDFLRPYRGHTHLELGSFRPLEEKGRVANVHKRNDLLHIDAFPTRPTGGSRILRVFVNLNPTHPRHWVTSLNFGQLLQHYGEAAGLRQIVKSSSSFWRRLRRELTTLPMRLVGKAHKPSSTYDEFMHHFHNWLKDSRQFQIESPKNHLDFPPGSSWMAFTDYVSHAVYSGQFALEQTFLIDIEGLVLPERAPIRLLESRLGQHLVA